MLAPFPNSTPPPARPDWPRVRLDVRTGPDRTVSYEVATDEFLIGGAAGCDLRLPVAGLPPVACQITHKPDGVRVRAVAYTTPVLLNGTPLPTGTPTALADADRLDLAGVEIAVGVTAATYLSPRLIPLDPGVTRAEPDRNAEWAQRDADLSRRQRDLDTQAEELEADRVLWYRRRQEMEQEAERFRTGPADLIAREQEVARLRDELAALREQLVREYHERRDELARAQEQVRDANAALHEGRNAFAAGQEQQRAALDAELREKRRAFAAELAGRATQIETEALDRYRAKMEDLERFQESLRDSAARLAEREAASEAVAAERVRQADDEIARRRDLLDAELAAYEPQRVELRDQQVRLAAAFHDLARQRDAFAADHDIFTRSRETFEAERAAEVARLDAWDRTLAARDDDLVRREAALHADRNAFAADRQQLTDDLLRLDRRRAEADDRDRDLAARTRDADARLEQLTRDAAEWEDTLRLATAEQDRLRTEADRLDRQRADLDAQTAKLSERAAQLDAQQGGLAVLRAKLDRTRDEVERETTALATARLREEAARAELHARIREAEELRATLGTVQENTEQERRRLEERDSLLATGLEEIRQQRDALAADEARVRQREAELDARSAEFAEQAGSLKGRVTQAFDLQARLEADRVAVREREAALAQAEEARQALQEQLRRRADDLAARSKALDEAARQVAFERTAVEQAKAAAETARVLGEEQAGMLRLEVEARAADVDRQSRTTAEREAALGRQVVRLKEVGQAVAAERKALAEARAAWDADRAAAEGDARTARAELDAFRTRAAADIEALRAQAPELEEQAKAALDRLTAAKDTLRGHLAELNDFARQNRADLDAVRGQVRAEADRLRGQEADLDHARADHRLAVTAFRQQLVEWQAKVGEMKQALARGESRLEARETAVAEAARQVDATTHELAEQADQLRRDRAEVVQRRTEVERHLADMREWYRKKLRELAAGRIDERRLKIADLPDGDEPTLGGVRPSAIIHHPSAIENEPDPGDRQLGELLRTLDLVDADTLAALWGEAGRQRRTLRQVLLASGAVTLYQLALIEAGNLDGLVLGRFRVFDKLRATPRETLYRVLDPTRLDARGGGVFLLRHLSESEMEDAVHPDEFRQRYAAARTAPHPNLAGVVEVVEINGRPAVLLEWLTGLFGGDWPAHAAHPGCWVRLATMAAEALDTAHRAGLAHGRLTSDAFVLTAAGVLKVTGFGEPPWLAGGPASPVEPSPAADLRAFGQVAFGWSQAAAKRRAGIRTKPFPAELAAVVRRLEADPEPPMADTVAADQPYASAAELVADLKRIARETPFSDDAWEKLLRHVAENAPEGVALRQSA